MKVLKHGNWNDDWSLEVTCDGCNALLKVEEEDVQPAYDKYNKFFCECPDCKKGIDLDEKSIHPRIVKKVETTRKYSGDY